MTQLLCCLQQKGAIGRFAAFGIDRRAKKALDAFQASLREYVFHSHAQTALHCARRGSMCLCAVCVQA